MQIEYEATFPNINVEDILTQLKTVGAILIRPEFMQKRAVFHLPRKNEIEGGWLRVRDEGNKITMSLKIVNGDTITDQKETCIIVNSFTEACDFLVSIGCEKKAYQETKRELWKIDDVEITIDTWPFLEPFVEIEGDAELSVKLVSEKLGFDYDQARFCHVGTLYGEKYGFHEEVFNNQTPLLNFEMENPFLKNEH